MKPLIGSRVLNEAIIPSLDYLCPNDPPFPGAQVKVSIISVLIIVPPFSRCGIFS